MIPDKECLDELRLLTNLQLDDVNLFSLVLIAQPEFRSRLLTGYCEPFRQRIGVQYHLNPLNFAEVTEYVKFRLAKAGRTEPLFTESSLKELFRLSNGIPRTINNLAAGALLEGFGRGAGIIEGDIIIEVARDFGLVTWHA
jgi:type II secretory pathway predicted ATPase ExeA